MIILIRLNGKPFSLQSLHNLAGFPGSSDDKESACNVGDPGLISGLVRPPGEGNGNPLQYSYLEKSHEQRSLAGYSPKGCKELDMTELLSMHAILKLTLLVNFT